MRHLFGIFLLLFIQGTSLTVNADAIVLSARDAGFANNSNTTSPLGSNLSPLVDYSIEQPFVNYFWMARPWFQVNPLTGEEFPNKKLSTDKDGNIKSLPKNRGARAYLFTIAPADPALANKTIDIFYDGEGDITYTGATVISQSAGHDVIQTASISNPTTDSLITSLTITRINKKNPLRNFRALPTGGICADNPLASVASSSNCPGGNFLSFQENYQTIVFSPEFLSNIKSYRTLRFMDWMQTNNSNVINPSKLPAFSNQFWTTEKGAPVEVMIGLANLMDIDPWFNIPHKANNAYVAKLADLVRDQLETGRKAYFEYSNEVWNGIFSQTEFAIKQGKKFKLNKIPEGTDDYIGMVRFYSKRSQEIFAILEKEIVDKSRFKRVMSTQAVNSGFTDEILKFKDAATVTDFFAIAPYFGDTIVTQAKRDELLRLGVDGVFDWLVNNNNSILDYGSLTAVDAKVLEQVQTASAYSIPIISYEGGQHFLGADAGEGDFQSDAALNSLFDSVNRDPRMKTIYLMYLTNWRARTGQQFNHYVNCDGWSQFGRWGSKEYPSQSLTDAPKYDALMSYISSNPLQ